MSGSKKGGLAAAQTNKQRYGESFYKQIGAKGGSVTGGSPKGFAYSAANGLDWHITAGIKGGTISRRKSTPTNKKEI